MKADLAGRVAVVLGGTSGIGRAIVLKYAECGAHVIFQGRSRKAADEVIAAVADADHAPRFVAADLYDYDAVALVMKSAFDAFGKIDIAVASGGTGKPKAALFDEISKDDLEGFFRTHAFQRIYALHAAFPYMKARGYGKLISVTTDAGRMPTPSESVIGAAAASIIFLTRALAREFARWGVRVNAISTTLTTDTPAYDRFTKERAAGSDAVLVKAFKKIESKAPFGLNAPADLAELALYLAAPESDQLSGATISVNGGISFPQY